MQIVVRAVVWVVAVLFFGLIQLWKPIFGCWASEPSPLSICFDGLFWANGVILFFSSALIASSAVELWLEQRVSWTPIMVLGHILLPFVLICLVLFVFDMLEPGTVLTKNLLLFQKITLLFTVLYTAGCKLYLGFIRPE